MIEQELRDDPYAQEAFSKLLREAIEETEKLKKLKKEAKALCALEKRRRIQKWREKVAGDAERGDGKAIWKVIGARKKGERNVIQPVTDLNGESHISETEVDKAWAEHWRGLYDGAQKWEEKTPQARDAEEESETLGKEIEERELDEALGRLKNWKSASGEGLPPELFKAARPGTPMFTILLELFNRVWREGDFPEEWDMAEVVPIHKKGAKTNMDNYRAISLIPVSLKILNGILA
ncbi:MAG: uncharacterized protein A8A55_3374, partial [Amphiamblys sp. WSBS2006]